MIYSGGNINWGKILEEYKESRKKIKNYNNYLKSQNSDTFDQRVEISGEMCSEMSETISSVKRNYLAELQSFLNSERSSVLTEKQRFIMLMRSKGFTMDEIGDRLNISKTAVYKSIKLSEKKMNKMI